VNKKELRELEGLHLKHVVGLFRTGGKTREECLRMLPERLHKTFRRQIGGVLHFKHVIALFKAGAKTKQECLTMLPLRHHEVFRIAIGG
jgi:hypothetical protein